MANNGYPTRQEGPNWTGAGSYTAVVGAGPEGQAYQQGLRTIAGQFQYQRIVQPLTYNPMTAAVGTVILGDATTGVNQAALMGAGPQSSSIAVRVLWCPTTTGTGTVTFDVRAYQMRLGEVAPTPGVPTVTETTTQVAPAITRLCQDTGLISLPLTLFPDDVIRLEIERGGSYADPVEVLGVFLYWEQVGPALAMLRP